MRDIFVRAKKHLLTLHLLMSKGLGEGVEAEQERDILEHLHNTELTSEEKVALDEYSVHLYTDQQMLVTLKQELKEVRAELRHPGIDRARDGELRILLNQLHVRIAEIAIKGEQIC